MKKLIVLLGVMIIPSLSIASKLKVSCSVKVLPTLCGSGEIKVNLFENSQFHLEYGDVGCWFSTQYYRGKYVSVGKPKGFTETFSLITGKNPEEERAVIASIELDEKNSVLLLDIDVSRFDAARGQRYHLQCKATENSNALKEDNYCNPYNCTDLKCITDCNLW